MILCRRKQVTKPYFSQENTSKGVWQCPIAIVNQENYSGIQEKCNKNFATVTIAHITF